MTQKLLTTFMTTYILILLLFYFIAPCRPAAYEQRRTRVPTYRVSATRHSQNARISIQRLTIRRPSISESVFASSGDEEERAEQGNGVYNHKSLCFFLNVFFFLLSGRDGVSITDEGKGYDTIYIVSSCLYKNSPSEQSSTR